MNEDYIIIAEMVTTKHGRIQFVSYGNGVWANSARENGIPRREWTAAMQAVVSGLPKELVYWEVAKAEYQAKGYA